MSARTERGSGTSLYGPDGRLITIRISVDAHLLEQVLELLAELPFPINPQLRHDYGRVSGHPSSVVEFPAYEGWVAEIQRAVDSDELTLDGSAGGVDVVDFTLDHDSIGAA